jgi:phospholipase/carboxylesterase
MELDHVMPALSLRNYIGIAPRGNVKSRGSQRRYRWGTTLTDCAVAEDLVWDSVRAAMNVLSIHSDRIFLAGFGGGGTMAQWIGLKYASQLAGVVSLTGAFPKTSRVLSNWKIARNLKVLFAQRQGSTICSEDDMMQAVKFAHQSGLDYRFLQAQSEDDTEGNELDAAMLQAANRFMMGIVTGTDLSLSPETSYDSETVEFGFN